MFMVFAGILSLSATALVLSPFIRSRWGTTSRTQQVIGVYHEQLDEIDRDLNRGLLTEKQAAVSKAEIERRINEATGPAEEITSGLGVIGRTLTAAAITLVLIAGAFSIYSNLGRPDQQDRPLATRTEALQLAQHTQRMDELSRNLAARLEENPGDAEGWAMLGRVHQVFGRFTESADAFARVHALRPKTATAAADHAEALVHVSEGIVSEAAERMFVETLSVDPKHVKARFYLGMALAKRPDEIARAIELWSSLEKDSPPDAPWLEALRANIQVARADLAAITEARHRSESRADMADPEMTK